MLTANLKEKLCDNLKEFLLTASYKHFVWLLIGQFVFRDEETSIYDKVFLVNKRYHLLGGAKSICSNFVSEIVSCCLMVDEWLVVDKCLLMD